jgi:hypothetical protein
MVCLSRHGVHLSDDCVLTGVPFSESRLVTRAIRQSRPIHGRDHRQPSPASHEPDFTDELGRRSDTNPATGIGSGPAVEGREKTGVTQPSSEPASSTSRQRALTSLACSTVRGARSSSRGLQTRIAKQRARDTATLSLLRL